MLAFPWAQTASYCAFWGRDQLWLLGRTHKCLLMCRFPEQLRCYNFTRHRSLLCVCGWSLSSLMHCHASCLTVDPTHQLGKRAIPWIPVQVRWNWSKYKHYEEVSGFLSLVLTFDIWSDVSESQHRPLEPVLVTHLYHFPLWDWDLPYVPYGP